MKQIFKVVGLDCAEEIAVLKKALGKREGILDLEFDVLNAKMVVTCEDQIEADWIIAWVKEGGMDAHLWSDREQFEKRGFWQKQGRFVTTVLSGLFLLGAVYFHVGKSPVADRLYFFAMVFGAYFVLPKAWLAIKRLQPDMNLLMVIAMGGAIAID
ncbi:MAG: cation transporter, partial [Chlamydiia bacterium]|nr:cation transporter [Chlamydiia bacterium]